MSLNRRESRATSLELHTNLELAGLTPYDVAIALGRAPAWVQATLDLAGARPEEVWLLRDYLDRAVRTAAATPVPWSVLTDQARATAQA